MPSYKSAEARAYCGGSFAPYAKTLALYGIDALLEEGGCAPFFSIGVEQGAPLLVIPESAKDRLTFTTVYRPKMGKLSADMLAEVRERPAFTRNWREIGSAYVTAVIDLNVEYPLSCLDHHATDRAAQKLLCPLTNVGHGWMFGWMIDGTIDLLRWFNNRRYGRDLDRRYLEMQANDFYKPQ